PKISTTLSATTTKPSVAVTQITLGQSVYDFANVLPASATGNVKFYVKIPLAADFVVFPQSPANPLVPLVSGQAMSAQYTPTALGQYYFKAEYVDGQVLSGTEAEPLDVVPQTGVETRLTKTEVFPTSPVASLTIDIGETVWDYAIVSNDPAHSGTVQFKVKEPGAADFVNHGTPVSLTQIGLDWVAKSAPYTATKWGQHYFKAVYTNGSEQQTPSPDGPLYVTPKIGTTLSTTTTKPSVAVTQITLGQSVYDFANVLPASATGNVKFYVKVPFAADFVVFPPSPADPNVLLAGGQAMSSLYTRTQAGRYYFKAMYVDGEVFSADDAEPLDVSDNINIETRLTTGETMPTGPVTQLDIVIGQTVWDYAIVRGDSTPTGSVQFYTEAPGETGFTPLGAPVSIALVGSDWVAKSPSYTPTTSGMHNFKTEYIENQQIVATGSLEPLYVAPKVVTILSKTTTKPTTAVTQITLGESVYDFANVLPSTLTGSVRFYVKVPGAAGSG
ncbi:MAG: hypothetical protein Q8P50_11575, partial [Bacillota bacterium]|nr:hypothetical protein [Bacillota bacterium]